MVSIFPPREERFLLLFPFLLLPGVLYSIYWGSLSFWGAHTETLLRLVCSVVFLNTVHVAFCFKMLLTFPEFQEYRRRNDSRARISLLGELTLVFLISFLFFQWAYVVNTPLVDALTVVFYIIVNYHHSLKQVEGLGVAYDQTLGARPAHMLEQQARQRRTEKKLFLILMVLSCMAILLLVLAGDDYPLWARSALFLAAVLVCLWIYLPILRFHPLEQSNKGWFMLRLFFFPLGLIDPASAIALNAFHGVEYLFVYRKMARQSTGRGLRSSFLWVTVPALVLLSLTRADVGLVGFFSREQVYAWPIRFMASLSMALAFLHFYVDGRLFNMSNADVRNTIGPLLASRWST